MNMRDLIKQLRYTAEVLEQLVGDSVMQEREWIAKDEQGLGKTLAVLSGGHKPRTKKHVIFDETFDKFPSREEFMEKWTSVPYRWSAKPVSKEQEKSRYTRGKYKKYVHWTKRPENKAKLAMTVKKMLAARKAKNGKK